MKSRLRRFIVMTLLIAQPAVLLVLTIGPELTSVLLAALIFLIVLRQCRSIPVVRPFVTVGRFI